MALQFPKSLSKADYYPRDAPSAVEAMVSGQKRKVVKSKLEEDAATPAKQIDIKKEVEEPNIRQEAKEDNDDDEGPDFDNDDEEEEEEEDEEVEEAEAKEKNTAESKDVHIKIFQPMTTDSIIPLYKGKLHEMATRNKMKLPIYTTEATTDGFTSTLQFNGCIFKSSVWSQNTRYSQQNVAHVAMYFLKQAPIPPEGFHKSLCEGIDGAEVNNEINNHGGHTYPTTPVSSRFLRIRNLPWEVVFQDIVTFFQGITIVEDGIMLACCANTGRALTFAWIEFPTIADAELGLLRNRRMLGERIVEIYRSSAEDYPKKGLTVFVRGTPRKKTNQQLVSEYFKPLEPIRLKQFDRKRTEQWCMWFNTVEEAGEAMKKHQSEMGEDKYKRYIECYLLMGYKKSTAHERPELVEEEEDEPPSPTEAAHVKSESVDEPSSPTV